MGLVGIIAPNSKPSLILKIMFVSGILCYFNSTFLPCCLKSITLISQRKKSLDDFKRSVGSFRKQPCINFNKEGILMAQENNFLLI
jgi:hypothetical protein